VGYLERESAQPANGGTVVALGIAVAQDQTDAQSIGQGDVGQLTRPRSPSAHCRF
jgi:hypothetical protein